MVNATKGASDLAVERGVDLETVTGSGKDGRIVKADVEKARPAELGVEDALRLELKEMTGSRSTLAASALALAREMDDPDNSATSKSMCARSLIETMERLLSLEPPKKENDRLDELSDLRTKRLAGRAAA